MTSLWYLSDPKRLSIERAAIDQLLTSTGWLTTAEWSLDNELWIGVDAVIRAHDHDYSVRLSYPPLFPDVPPIVRPSDPEARWSGHQYVSGTLCLEWGPDTWHSDVTGAMMLESAYRLLSLENPLGDASVPGTPAPSRHQLTLGQSLRNKYWRYHHSANAQAFLRGMPTNAKRSAKVVYYPRTESALVLLVEVGNKQVIDFKDTSVPSGFDGDLTMTGLVIRSELPAATFAGINSRQELDSILGHAGLIEGELDDTLVSMNSGEASAWPCVFVIDGAGGPHVFVLNMKDRKCYPAEIILDESSDNKRTPENIRAIRTKSVALVGAGSLGSKIATSLARMGIARFLIIDEDVFKRENLCRHALDWRSVGEHKADGMAALLRLINPNIEVEVSRLNLTAQESNQAISTAISKLAHYDLIIDGTADPRVFNILSAAARAYAKPVVWAEVFAGGIGGIIGRSRPSRDPDPQTMRAAYYEYVELHPFSDAPIVSDYTREDAEGNVITATDADVEVIAAQTARLAADTLLAEVSTFPQSLYLLGLTRAWVFEAPFHTIPIATDHLVRPPASPNESALDENKEFLIGLLEEARKDLDASSPS